MHVGLKVARLAVWGAALTLAALRVKQLCYEAADSACSTARASWVLQLSQRGNIARLRDTGMNCAPTTQEDTGLEIAVPAVEEGGDDLTFSDASDDMYRSVDYVGVG